MGAPTVQRFGSAARRDPACPWTVHDVIDLGAVQTVFQPVVHIATGTVAGFEALSRGPAGSSLENPNALFEAAAQVDRVGDLDWLCRATAMRRAADAALPESLCWLVNVEPAGLTSECPPELLDVFQRARTELRVVLELVERDIQANLFELIQTVDRARLDVWGVALDDVGAEPASLAVLPLVRPDIVKLDMSLVQHLPRARTAAAAAAVRAYVEDSGAVILAEGIETREHVALARVLGATYAQGYYYARPGPLPAHVRVPVEPIPLREHVERLDGRTPFDTLTSEIEPQRAGRKHLRHIAAHLEREAGRGGNDESILLTCLPADEVTDAKRRRLRHVAESSAFTAVLADGAAYVEEPTFRVRPLSPASPLSHDWMVIVVNAHFAGAFVARAIEPADQGARAGAQREFEFVYSHRRDAVVRAARSFLHHLDPNTAQRLASRLEARFPGSPPSTAVHQLPAIDLAPVEMAAATLEMAGTGIEHSAFAAAARVVLRFLNTHMRMTVWSVTRVENERQTVLFLDDNDFGVTAGYSTPWEDTFCVNMVDGVAPPVAPNVDDVPAYAAARDRFGVEVGAYAGLPIADGDGSLFGVICGLNRTPQPELAQVEHTLAAMSQLLTVALRADRALQFARDATRTALSSAMIDPLTGIPNRRAWDAVIKDVADDYATYADPTVVVLVDLDNLKAVNDGPGGHAAGDRHLRGAADVLRRSIREHDFLARLGGDEFGIVFQHTPVSHAPELTKRVCRALARACIDASVGWSALAPDIGIGDAIELADRAMYETKRRRRSGPAASFGQPAAACGAA